MHLFWLVLSKCVNFSETGFIEEPPTAPVYVMLPDTILIDIFNGVANNLMGLLH